MPYLTATVYERQFWCVKKRQWQLLSKARYAPCQGCHGAKAEGRKPVGPSLDKTSDWYFVVSMQKYRDGVRPADPKLDPTAMAMAGMARLLPDDQAVLDVYAYIRSLSE